MTEDEVAAHHEAAHAVFAVFGAWTKLAGPVILRGPGYGDVRMSTDTEAIRRAIAADPGFDRDRPRIHLVRCLLAGPIAERMLHESGRAAPGEDELETWSSGDYAVIAEQLDQLDPPRPGLLARLESEVRQGLDDPGVRFAVERFAAVLLDRRRLEAEEASAILIGMRAGRRPLPAGLRLWETVLRLIRRAGRSHRWKGDRSEKMNRKVLAVLAVAAAVAFAAYMGFRDGREHRDPPEANSASLADVRSAPA